ncbi:MAG: hypothetical protein JNG88_08470 [Phycisphaerales bacterium]|nr:hypothetical protein [Phycisphaerales bacterium]
MNRSVLVAFVALASLGTFDSWATVLQFTTGGGGYVAFTRNAQNPPSNAYSFDSQFGILTLRWPGLWYIRYQDFPVFGAGNPIDIRGVLTTWVSGAPSGQLIIDLQGRDVVGTVDLDSMANADPFGQFELKLTGSIPNGVTVFASSHNLGRSYVNGNLAGRLNIYDLIHLPTGNQYDLDIGGQNHLIG